MRLCRLRQIQQVVQENRLICNQEAVVEGFVGCLLTKRFITRNRKAQEVTNHRANGILALSDTER